MPSIMARILARCGAMIPRLQCTLIYAHDLSKIPTIELAEECSVRQIGPDELHFLEHIWKHDPDELRARLKAGGLCYTIFMGGRPAHYSWVQSSGIHPILDAGTEIAIEDGDLWIYHCRTAAWARGRRLYPFALSQILRDFKHAGFRRGWIYTTAENAASQNGIKAAGFLPVRRLRAFRIAGLTIAAPGTRTAFRE
jgi:hypothetical protein